MMNLIGKWAFVLGVIAAILLGIAGKIDATVAIVLIVIGLIVGLLNIASKDVSPFLLAGVSLILATFFGKQSMTAIPAIANVLEAILILVVPAVVIVSVREVFTIATKVKIVK